MIKKKLKICHISFSDSKGGASKAAYKFHEYLKKENDLESYFFSRHNLNKDTIPLNNSWIGKIRFYFALNISRLILYIFKDNLSLNIFPSHISNKLNSYKFDVFHLHWVNNETLSLNDLINLKKPLFVTFHDMYYFNLLKNYSKDLELKKNQLKKINFFKKNIFEKKKIFFKKKPIVFIPTHWLYNQYKLSEFFDSQKTYFLPYLFDYTNEYKRRVKDNKINIGFVADRPFEDKRKNLKYTIDLLNSLPKSLTKKITLNIAGKINNFPKVNYRFKIKYFNFMSQLELKKFYKQNNFIFSFSFLENSSLVVLESLFSGTPVVTLKNTGPETLVKKIKPELVLKTFEKSSAINEIQNILKFKLNQKIKYNKIYNNPLIYKKYINIYKHNVPIKKTKINVLHLSSSFKEGGAFKAAKEIFFMFQKIPNIKNKYYEFRKEVGLFKFYYSRRMDQKYFKKKINSYFSSGLNETFYIYGTKDFIEADVIVLYWINDGFLSIKELEKILSSGKKIIWRFSDMWPLTGGCHYSYGCKKFVTSCKACPQLEYNSREDIVSKIFNEKLNWNTKNLTVVCPSHWIRSRVKLSKIFKDTKSITIHTHVNEKFFNIKKIKRELLLDKYSIPKNKYIVLYGSANFKLDHRKGYEYFKRSINYLVKKKKIDDFFFIFIGEKKFESQNSKLNYKNFKFIKNKIQLSEIYNLADIFLFTSIEENFSNMILESLNCGTPVVAFNIGGNKEIIKNGINGYLQNKISHFELDKIILKTNKLNRKKISQSIINKFNQKKTIKKYSKILNESK